MEVEAQHAAFPRVTIEYCTRCKWMLRAAYYAQELLSTFEGALAEVSLRPASSGTFRVHITTDPSLTTASPAQPTFEHPFADSDDEGPPLYPRSTRPSTSSHRPSAPPPHTENIPATTDVPPPQPTPIPEDAPSGGLAPEQGGPGNRRPSAVAHTANPEVADALGEVTGASPPQGLSGRRRRPSAIAHTEHPELGDTLRRVSTNTRTLWDRRVDGGFPETKELKRRVRDVIEPGRNLGHVDGRPGAVGAGAGAHEGGRTCEVPCKDCQ